MRLTKLDIQQRVLQGGKPIGLIDFLWEEETRTFSSYLNGLVLDFKGIRNVTFNTSDDCTFKTSYNCTFNTGDNCTFNTSFSCAFKTGFGCIFDTGSFCTFNTGDNCTFNTLYNCTFDTSYKCTFDTSYNCTFDTGYSCIFKTSACCTFETGYDCTFDTGYNCTFKTEYGCVVIRRDIFEVIQLEENKKYKLNPYSVKGYLKEIDSKMYLNGEASLGEHIIVDGILSKIISRKANILKVINHGQENESFIVSNGTEYSHGSTIKEAKVDLIYKASNRDAGKYDNLTITDILSKEEAIKMYIIITGACSYGIKMFVNNIDTKDEYTVSELIALTKGQFGNEKLIKFFEEK